MLDIFSSNDPLKIVEKSTKLRVEGKHDKAEQLLKKSIKNSKSDFIILLELAKTQFEMGKISESVTSLKNSYLISPEEMNKILNVCEDLHYRSNSQKDLTAALLFELYIKKRNFEALKKIFDTLSQDEIKNLISNFDKQFKNIKSTKTVEQLTKKDIETYLITGILYLYNKNFNEAKPILEIVFRTQVKERDYILNEYLNISKITYVNPAPFMAIGDLYLIINDKDKAITYFQKALTIDPKIKSDISTRIEEHISDTTEISESSKYSIIDFALEKKDYIKAIDLIEEIIKDKNQIEDELTRKAYQIIQNAPELIEGYKVLSKIFFIKKDLKNILTQLEKIYELNRDENTFILDMIDKLEKENLTNEEILIFKANILFDKDEIDASSLIAKSVYFKNNSFTFDTEKLVNRILDKNPDNLNSLETICQIYLDKKEDEKLKQLCEYILSKEKDEYLNLSKKYLEILYNKNPDDIDVKLNLSLAMLKTGKIKESEIMIIETLKIKPETFYIIIPNFYNPAQKDKEVAQLVLKILRNIDKSKIDPFLYNFSLCEMSYLASEIEFSIGILKEMFQKFPEKENELLELLDRIKKSYPENEIIYEFEFNFFLEKKEYQRAFESLMVFRNDKTKLGHLLDNLYTLNKLSPENIQLVEELFSILVEMGFYEKIIKEYEQLTTNLDQQKTGKIKFYLGKAYSNKGMVNDAATVLYQAIILDKSVIENSLNILNELLKYDPFSLRIHYTLSLGYFLLKQIDDAVKEMMEIVRIDQNQTEIVINELEKWNENIKNNPLLTFSVGTLYLEKGEYQKGISKLYETFEMDSSYLDRIINMLTGYIEKESENGEILFATGIFYSKKGLYKLASDYLYNAMSIETELRGKVITQLQFIINQQPEEIDARFSLAQVYKDMHNYMQAIALLRQIELINPGETENVINFYNEMLVNEPNNTFLLISLADSNMKIGKFKEAVELYSKIVKKNKKYIDEIIDRIIDLENKDVDLQLFLVDLYFEKDDYENASNWLNFLYLTSDITTFTKIIEKANLILTRDPRNSKIVFLLSHIYFDLKEYDKLIRLTSEIYEKTTKDDEKIRYGILLAEAYKFLNKEEKRNEILNTIKNVDSDLYYDIVYQMYEEEKSKKSANMEKMFNEKKEKDENLLIEYALMLIKQQRYYESINILNTKLNDENLEFERIYLLSLSYEKVGNITFALEIASKLRNSSSKKHINHLINLMKKLGYYGEIEGMLKAKKMDESFSSEFMKTKYYRNLFSDYRIII